jgi:hypothetical protein
VIANKLIKDMEGSRCVLIGYYPGICLEGHRKPGEIPDNQRPGSNSKIQPPEHKSLNVTNLAMVLDVQCRMEERIKNRERGS